jgi:fucose permease
LTIGIGATLAPIIATLISRSTLWSNYYFIPLGLTLTSLVAIGLSFRNEYSADPSSTDESRRNAQRGKLTVAVRNKITWIAATFIFLYEGAEVALGGWLVTFMIQVLHQSSGVDGRFEEEIRRRWGILPLDFGLELPWGE